MSSGRKPWVVGMIDESHFPNYSLILPGVHDFFIENRAKIRFTLLKLRPTLEETLGDFDGDGVLGHLYFPDTEKALKARNMKAVSLLRAGGVKPAITVDHAACGELVANHLLERGHKLLHHFIDGSEPNRDLYLKGIQRAAMERSAEVRTFLEGKRTKSKGKWVLEDQLLDLADWISAMPKPCAIICSDIIHAQRVYKAVSHLELSIPEDVSVASCRGSRTICEFIEPPMTSVATDFRQLGWTGARMIFRILDEEHYEPPEVRLLTSFSIETRRSTLAYATNDRVVAMALQYIEDHLDEPIQVDDLAKATQVSRSTLERRFCQVTGKQPGQVIRRARADRARNLLTQTHLSLLEVALECGIEHPAALTGSLSEVFGQTASELGARSQRAR